MENVIRTSGLSNRTKSIILDISALLAIYLVPVFSHLAALPVYFIEPMRIMLILSLAHTTKRNTYLIALTLPVFSFLISAHPSLVKTVLMSFELLLNVWLFYAISQKISNKFGSMFLSIAISKVFFYLIKFALVVLALWSSNLVSIPIYFQAIMTLLFSTYIYFSFKKSD